MCRSTSNCSESSRLGRQPLPRGVLARRDRGAQLAGRPIAQIFLRQRRIAPWLRSAGHDPPFVGWMVPPISVTVKLIPPSPRARAVSDSLLARADHRQRLTGKAPMTTVPTAHVPEHHGGFRPTEYAHIVLKTAQPDTLIEWYCAVLGVQVAVRNPLISFLTWDHSQDRLAIVPIPGAVAPRRTPPGCTMSRFAVDAAGAGDQYRTLKSQGILPVRAMNHGVATSMYYADPDGNQIELTVEAFPWVRPQRVVRDRRIRHQPIRRHHRSRRAVRTCRRRRTRGRDPEAPPRPPHLAPGPVGGLQMK